MSRREGDRSTAERMRDRKASMHILLTRSAEGHMPFAGHRRLSEVGGMPALLRSERGEIRRIGSYERRNAFKIAAE